MPKAKLTQPRAFAWAKAQGKPFRARELAKAFEVPLCNATMVLLYLKRKGAMERHGHTHTARWYVLDARAEVRSLKGTNPNSLANLRTAGGKGRPIMQAIPKFRSKGRDDWPAATMLETLWQRSYTTSPHIDATAQP